MPGLLDDALIAGLLGQPQPNQQGFPAAGLLAFRPGQNEGLLTSLFGDPRNPTDPRADAMMAFGAGLARKDPIAGFLGANQAIQGTEDRNWRRAANALTMNRAALEVAGLQQAYKRQAAIDRELAGLRAGQGAAPVPVGGGPAAYQPEQFGSGSFGSVAPSPGVPAMPSIGEGATVSPGGIAPPGSAQAGVGAPQSPQQVYADLLQTANVFLRNGDAKTANEYFQRAAQFKQKFSPEPRAMVGADGKLGNYLVSEDGTVQALPYGVKPDISLQDVGNRIIAVDRNNTPGGASFGKTMTPDAVASNALGWANNRVSRERLAFDQGQAQQPQFHDGQWVTRPNAQSPQGTATPVPNFRRPLGEKQRNQIAGIDALGGAIDEYLKELDGFGVIDFASPDARARMGTKYNNMMLQAKEAYNLGVLNGPDYQILTSIVTDPTSRQGFITSKEALGDQARELKRVMGIVRAAAGGQSIPPPAQQDTTPVPVRAVPLPRSPKVSDLSHGTVYQLPNGASARWDSMQRKFVEVQ